MKKKRRRSYIKRIAEENQRIAEKESEFEIVTSFFFFLSSQTQIHIFFDNITQIEFLPKVEFAN